MFPGWGVQDRESSPELLAYEASAQFSELWMSYALFSPDVY